MDLQFLSVVIYEFVLCFISAQLFLFSSFKRAIQVEIKCNCIREVRFPKNPILLLLQNT